MLHPNVPWVHSFGAMTAVAAAAEDTRFKAVLSLDLWTEPGDRQLFAKGLKDTPLLLVQGEGWSKGVNHAPSVELHQHSHPASKLETIKGANHINFTDFAYLAEVRGCLTKGQSLVVWCS